MITLYPLQMVPEFVERVWGAHDLSFMYQHSVGAKAIGEVWLTGEQCRVANGPLKGKTIAELCVEFGGAFTGKDCANHRFPLLMKVLFPREKLSVQVHPDDLGAQRVGEPCGKTECWYVLQAEAGAQIGLGFHAGTTRQEIEAAIGEKRMEHLLNWIDVHEGDMFYVDAGTVHAIGAGSIILETQQNSDTTYRLYDYGRPRELHIAQGLAAMKDSTHAGRVPRDGEKLIESPCFEVERMDLRAPRTMNTREPNESGIAHCLFAMDGAARIEVSGAQPTSITRGEVVIVPAALGSYRIVPQWSCDIVCASLPATETAEPNTQRAADCAVASARQG